MVLSTAENIHFQELGVQVWVNYVQARLPNEDPLRIIQEIFKRNLNVIQRFGRFPHRNRVLGRKSTEKEGQYLEDVTAHFDDPLKFDQEGNFVREASSKDETPWPELDFSTKIDSLKI
ncbi:uncharacterized protein LOC111704327 [Eurytemora carolleeae]|uniref:uncharacterized protein LOC111704327 n=1 Tax=Eurytemora carolleeae TaxID=1294199 RepID=UPI000C774837|nr:uncharacterized protein LOC111704327 [Eurytemora carolleeae]|eukprot:XP_023332317.1 uncharacterized protein LOC111704327 [Eurytemora affinis]